MGMKKKRKNISWVDLEMVEASKRPIKVDMQRRPWIHLMWQGISQPWFENRSHESVYRRGRRREKSGRVFRALRGPLDDKKLLTASDEI